MPRAVVRQIASRYVAGERLDDAVAAVRALNSAGRMATVDVLGEEIRSEAEAEAIADEYAATLDAIERERLDANLSVKLTALGLGLSFGTARRNLERIVVAAHAHGIFVRVDMEDSSTTDDTLRLYRELRAAGHENVGVVLQAALRRTLDDIASLADLRPSVRLCKGIYVEPPAVAFQDADEIRVAYARASDALLDAGSYVGFATHDEALIGAVLESIESRGFRHDEYELQFLLGVRPDRAGELVAAGHRLRVYVPFGTHWYGYSLRRLQENPAIAGYVAADLVRRVARLPSR